MAELKPINTLYEVLEQMDCPVSDMIDVLRYHYKNQGWLKEDTMALITKLYQQGLINIYDSRDSESMSIDMIHLLTPVELVRKKNLTETPSVLY